MQTPSKQNHLSGHHALRVLLLVILILGVYRGVALYFSGVTLYLDEAQYWVWAKSLAWGYFSKPPMIAALIAATTQAFGDGEFAVKCGSLLLYPLTTLLVFVIAKRLTDPTIALWSAIAFFTLPGVALSSMIISTDVLLFLFWTLATYALIRGAQTNAWGWWLLLGLAAGGGLLSKYTMGIFAVSALLYLAVFAENRRYFLSAKPYVAALIAALIFAPNLLWNADNNWPTFAHTAQISHLDSDPGLHWDELWDFVIGQAGIVGPVFYVVFLLVIFKIKTVWNTPSLRALACFAFPFLGVIALQALFGRANANWAAMTYATATILIVAWMLTRGLKTWLLIAIGINLLLSLLVYHYLPITKALDVQLTRKTQPFKRVLGWDEAGKKVQAQLVLHPQAQLLTDSRDIHSEMRYYARPQSNSAVIWNPSGSIDSHYHLTTTLKNQIGRDFILVTRSPVLSAEIAQHFSEVELLPRVFVPIVPDWNIDLHLYLLRDFKGY